MFLGYLLLSTTDPSPSRKITCCFVLSLVVGSRMWSHAQHLFGPNVNKAVSSCCKLAKALFSSTRNRSCFSAIISQSYNSEARMFFFTIETKTSV